MIFEASLVALWAFFCGIDKYDVALNIHRPLITGPVVGLIMGDMQVGLIAGATLELAWLGLVPNAGAQPPDVTLGTIAAVAFAGNDKTITGSCNGNRYAYCCFNADVGDWFLCYDCIYHG
ncbi:N-acetylgalactosamine-specific PTS system, EIIC component [Proteus mirabilis]|uniref:N-acetylgalactosamine-specific PTS system, EIIC component n=1 Tax=Proteus mirabilis TaxID=584 RepID=A0A2X2BCI0_PROMI|nr:N-acetylgalactosamine-specific PTS system, EIIC component [Proteus mirabilis]